LLVVAAILGGWRLWQYYQVTKASKALSLAKDSIILADFDNKSGDPVFDTTLTQAFAILMEQSPVLKLVNQQHIRQSMQYLGKSQDDPVTPAIAREIGEREGVKAYLIGSIAKLGNSYLISVTAQNIRTGDDIAVEEAEASDKDHVFDALGKVATAMRARLGESLSSIEKLDTPFDQATTPSLEAFRAFALGDVEHAKGLDVPEAEGHYLQAVEIDPNFAMAWARLGVVYNNSGQLGKANQAYTKGYGLSKNVSERERLYIEGQYYQTVTGNLEKAREALDLGVKTYPLDVDLSVTLSVVESNLGGLPEAEAAFQRALQIMPDDAITLEDLLQVYFQLDQMDEAAKMMADIHQRQLDKSDSVLTVEYPIFYVTGDSKAMEDAKQRVQGRPYESFFNMAVALVDEFGGQYHLAETTWKKAADEAVVIKSPDSQASRLLYLVTGRALAGMTENGAQTVKAALALDKSKPTLVQAVFAAALVNDRADALPLIAKLDKDYPEDTIIQQVVLPESRAALALAADDPASALHDLEPAKAYYLIAPEAYLEGLAHLEIHDGASAVEAFQRVTKYKGNAVSVPMQDYGQGLLGLARAYTMTGNKAAAKKAYEDLLAVWKNADQDLAMLQTAKKEYATLQ
jgi:tetratricopeptide (TPR) repeat protein